MQVINDLNLCLVSVVLSVVVAPEDMPETDEPVEEFEDIEDIALDLHILTDSESVVEVAQNIEANPSQFMELADEQSEFEILSIKECHVTRVDFADSGADGVCALLFNKKL